MVKFAWVIGVVQKRGAKRGLSDRACRGCDEKDHNYFYHDVTFLNLCRLQQAYSKEYFCSATKAPAHLVLPSCNNRSQKDDA